MVISMNPATEPQLNGEDRGKLLIIGNESVTVFLLARGAKIGQIGNTFFNMAALPGHLPGDASNQARVTLIAGRMAAMTTGAPP